MDVMADLGITTPHYPPATAQAPPATAQAPAATPPEEQMYKEHLSLLIARGKTKEFIGKTITYSDLDRMAFKDLERYYRLYEAAQASKINQAVTNGVINMYTKVCGFITQVDPAALEKLNKNLKDDFLVTNQIEQWSSFLSFKMGGVMSLVSAAMITFENLNGINERTGATEGTHTDEKAEIGKTD